MQLKGGVGAYCALPSSAAMAGGSNLKQDLTKGTAADLLATSG